MPLIRPPRGTRLIHATPDHSIFLRRGNVPLVVTFHGYFLDPFIRPFSTLIQNMHYASDLRWLTRAALKRATAVTAVSNFVADMVKKDIGYGGDIRVIYNGVDTVKFSPAPRPCRREVRVLFSGNLTQRKGGFLLPEIAKLLPPDIVIWYTQGLRSRATLPKLPNLRCIGNVPHNDMPKLYKDVDILLMPSVREGCSMAVIEAMASGLPVIASNCSSLSELVANHDGGLLSKVGDAGEFSKNIRTLASSYTLRQEMGAFNRAVAESTFTTDKMTSKYVGLFEELIC